MEGLVSRGRPLVGIQFNANAAFHVFHDFGAELDLGFNFVDRKADRHFVAVLRVVPRQAPLVCKGVFQTFARFLGEPATLVAPVLEDGCSAHRAAQPGLSTGQAASTALEQ